jgi:hypothetical protein
MTNASLIKLGLAARSDGGVQPLAVKRRVTTQWRESASKESRITRAKMSRCSTPFKNCTACKP